MGLCRREGGKYVYWVTEGRLVTAHRNLLPFRNRRPSMSELLLLAFLKPSSIRCAADWKKNVPLVSRAQRS